MDAGVGAQGQGITEINFIMRFFNKDARGMIIKKKVSRAGLYDASYNLGAAESILPLPGR